jgi:hypothetical protein
MKKLIIMLAVISLMTSVSCNTVEAEPNMGNGEVSPAEDEEDAIRIDAEMYAADQGVSVDEAVRRFELMNDAGPLQAAIVENEADTYAGSWIQHQPEYRFIFAFTENGEEIIKKYVTEDSPLAGLIELRTFEVSYKELREAQEETMQLLKDLDLDFFCATGTNIKENTAEVYVSDSKLFNKIMREAGVQLPPHVTQVVTYEPLEEVPFEVNPPDQPVHFPQMKMRGALALNGGAKTLVLKDGYLRFGEAVIIWQPDYFLNSDNGTIEVLDREGEVVARVGEEVYMTFGGLETAEEVNRYVKEPLPEDCPGPFFIQGHGTRLNLNFSSDLFSIEITPFEGHDFYIFKKRSLIEEMVTRTTEINGKLVASSDIRLFRYPYITVYVNGGFNMQCTTLWPAEYEARVEDGVFEITDGSGNCVIRDGEEVRIEGTVLHGINSDVTSRLYEELPDGCCQPYLIVNRVLGSEE